MGVVNRFKIFLRDFKNEHFMTRNKKMREGIDTNMKGLEIGPSYNPCVSKKEGYNVEILDWLSQEDLREHYKNHPVNLDNIEEVDYVWKGGSYYEAIQKENYFDYVISSHSIEHTTDMIGFLQDMAKVLKPNGIIRLAIPDKRYEFDYFREITDLGEILNNYYDKSTSQSVGNVVEYHMNVAAYNNNITWGKSRFFPVNIYRKLVTKNYSFVHDINYVQEMRDKSSRGEYIDIHHYCFTPASFEYLIYSLQVLGLIPLEIISQYPPRGNEFIVTLRKTDRVFQDDPKKKMKLLKKRNRENRI